MAVFWKCDICGKPTQLNPPSRIEVDAKGAPVMTEMRRQDPQTGEVRKVPVPKMVDLFPRAYLLRLCVGSESLQRDFCKECLEALRPQFDALWRELENIKPDGEK